MIVMSDVSGRARPAGRESAALVAGKYHLLTELGRGGMAVVHAAIATGMGGFTKLVVLKRARAADLADRPEAVRTSLNEARISARMNHPNVVQVYEVYEEQGLPVIVMEYLDGQPLSLLLSRHFKDPTSLPELPLNVLCRALEGLQYAHSLADFDGRPLNLIHRDVSPQNIMVTYDGQVKLLDFGIAKLDQASGDTKTGMIKGKVAYMPPEQIEGSELDGRTDLFAIGVMIWEVAARKRMWGSQGDAAVIRRLSLHDVPCLRAAAPEASEELVRICKKATATARAERYESAQALLADLQAYLHGRGGVVPDVAIAQWVNATCSDLKASARQTMGEKLTEFSQASTPDLWDGEFTSTGSERRAHASRLEEKSTGTAYAVPTFSQAVRLPRRQPWPFVAALALGGVALVLRGAVVERAAPDDRTVAAPAVVSAGGRGAPDRAQPSSDEPVSAPPALDAGSVSPSPVLGASVASSARSAGVTPFAATTAHAPAPSRASQRRRPSRARSAPTDDAVPTQQPAAAEVAPAPSRCDTPFSIDGSGIKRYNPDCLRQ